MQDHKELGRELRVEDLKPKTIVFINAEHRSGIFLSLWVVAVNEAHVELYAGEGEITLRLQRAHDGVLKDDLGRVIRLFEYLGPYPDDTLKK